MRPKTIYLALCFVGALLPYRQFLPWLFEHGPNLVLLPRELFVNRISAFFGLEVIVSALALFVFVGVESSQLGMRRWCLPLLAVLAVGVSLGLPIPLHARTGMERGRTLWGVDRVSLVFPGYSYHHSFAEVISDFPSSAGWAWTAPTFPT